MPYKFLKGEEMLRRIARQAGMTKEEVSMVDWVFLSMVDEVSISVFRLRNIFD